jgi:lipopolysaccharide export system protein LptA
MRTSTAVLACLLGAGCASTHVQRLDDTARPVRAPETVTVFTEAPQRPYSVIAVIESKSGSAFDSFDDLRREMVAKAAELGGDALILGPESTDEGFILTGTAMIRTEDRRIRGQVIVYGGATGL